MIYYNTNRQKYKNETKKIVKKEKKTQISKRFRIVKKS